MKRDGPPVYQQNNGRRERCKASGQMDACASTDYPRTHKSDAKDAQACRPGLLLVLADATYAREHVHAALRLDSSSRAARLHMVQSVVTVATSFGAVRGALFTLRGKSKKHLFRRTARSCGGTTIASTKQTREAQSSSAVPAPAPPAGTDTCAGTCASLLQKGRPCGSTWPPWVTAQWHGGIGCAMASGPRWQQWWSN
jgi:hypothetical protein